MTIVSLLPYTYKMKPDFVNVDAGEDVGPHSGDY